MFLGIDIGFWLGMGIVTVATIAMVIVAWNMPPKSENKEK